MITPSPRTAKQEGFQARELTPNLGLAERESAKAVFEHRLSENTLGSTNVKGKL